jgi:hypothetical protein
MQNNISSNPLLIKESVDMKSFEDPNRRKDEQNVRTDGFEKLKETREKHEKDHSLEKGEIRDEFDKRTPDFSRRSKKGAFDFGSSS